MKLTTIILPALGLLMSTPAWAGPVAGGDPEAGSAIYHQTCVACHGENGKGLIPGTPDFTDPAGVLSLSDEVLADRIVHGFRSNGSPMAMPPDGGNPALTPADIDNVISYLRKTFGH